MDTDKLSNAMNYKELVKAMSDYSIYYNREFYKIISDKIIEAGKVEVKDNICFDFALFIDGLSKIENESIDTKFKEVIDENISTRYYDEILNEIAFAPRQAFDQFEEDLNEYLKEKKDDVNQNILDNTKEIIMHIFKSEEERLRDENADVIKMIKDKKAELLSE